MSERKKIRMKRFVTFTLIVGALGIYGNTFAQSAASTEVAPAAPSALTFSPYVNSGVRSVFTGKFKGTGESNTVGPYLIPAAELAYKGSDLKASFTYELEMSSAKGFGDASESRDFSQNTYFAHHPMWSVVGGINPNWKYVLTGEAWIENTTESQANNFYIAFIPEIERKINDRLSVSAGYFMERETNYDSTIRASEKDFAALAKAQSGKAATEMNSSELNSLLNGTNAGNEPTSTIHSGLLRAKYKFTDSTSINSYVRVGRVFDSTSLQSSQSNLYRFNADLSTTPIEKLSLALRYRYQAVVPEDSSQLTSNLNRGRVIADYELGQNTTIELVNTFDAKVSGSWTNDWSYANEQYLGLIYKF